MYNENGSADVVPLRRRRSPSPSNLSKKARLSPTIPSLSRQNTSNGHTLQSVAMTSPLKPLSLSILGVEPLDEFMREIADWIHGLIMSRPQDLGGQIEVEAKLGVLKYKHEDARVNFPVLVETILADSEHRFESNMTKAQHKHLNDLLNELETKSRQPGHPTSPLRHQHSYLTDSFYPFEGRDGEKVRVTRDTKTSQVKECLRKIRLGNLDVYSPKWNADWRISVNMEVPASHPMGSASFTRQKDRMSYLHEEFTIDLTQVTQNSGPGTQQVMHELELEFARPAILLSTAAVRGDVDVSAIESSAFDELIRAFINNVHILVRNIRPV